jgi:hypothetical protein
VIAALGLVAALAAAPAGGVALDVPLLRQAPEHCGPAALQMVMRYYGAGRDAEREADRAYDPVLRGALVTELALAAKRSGFQVTIETVSNDSLVALLHEGVPPIVLYQTGFGPVTRAHYAVVVGWEPDDRFVLHDGGARPRHMAGSDLARRRRGGDDHALVLRRAP